MNADAISYDDGSSDESKGPAGEPETTDAGFLDDDDLKNTLLTCIDGFSNTGHFAAKGVLTSANPGLEVSGVGRFGVPLAERDINQLIGGAGQAPYGKGSETIVDTSVRKTWEIDGSRVQLRHPAWPAQHKQILEDVCKQLGIPDGAIYVQAQLYKLLVYEPGAIFKPHKDTEKAPRMFGTLAVTLPCDHTGGELLLSFNGQREVYSSSADAEWSSPYFAWFADVLHEVRPVLSGHRIVLTYNLVHTGPMATPGLLNRNAQLSSLSSVLRKWKAETDILDLIPNWLIYQLEHKYTEVHLNLNHLKGNDHSRAEAIVAACDQADFVCYLCTMEKMVDGAAEEESDYGYGEHHEIFDICDESLKLPKVVAMDGTAVISNVNIEENDIIQADIFEDRDPDSEEYEGWTGNEGASATHWYRDTGLLIMPKSKLTSWFVQNGTSTQIREMFEADLAELGSAVDSREQHTFVDRWRKVVRETGSQELALLMVQVSLKSGWLDAVKEALDTIKTKAHGVASVREALLGYVKEAAAFYSFAELAPIMDSILALHAKPEGMQGTIYWVSRLPKSSSLSDQIKNLEQVAGSCDSVSRDDQQKLLQWKRDKLGKIMTEASSVDLYDATTFVSLAIQHENSEWIDKQSSASKIFGEAAQALLERSTILTESSVGQPLVPQGFFKKTLLHDDDVLFLHDLLCANNLQSQIRELMDKVKEESIHATTSICKAMIIPYLQELLHPVEDVSMLENGSDHQPFFTTILENVICRMDLSRMDGREMTSIHSMLDTLQLEELRYKLMDKIRTECATVNPSVLNDMVLPYLTQLLHRLRIFDTPLDDAHLRSLFQTVLFGYVVRWVGREPTTATSWRLLDEKRPCGCHECGRLEAFLRADERIGNFAVKQERRKHLEIMLPSDRSRPNAPNNLFTTTVEKKGSPHVLVITKTRKRIAWDLDSWRKRKLEATKKLKELCGKDDSLRPLLGECYDGIMSLSLIGGESTAQTFAGPLSATDPNASRAGTSQNQQLASTKRPRDGDAERSDRDAKRIAMEVITID